MISAVKSAGEAVHYFGLPVTLASYSSSVVPILLGVWFLSIVEHFMQKTSPKAVKFFTVPLVSLFVAGSVCWPPMWNRVQPALPLRSAPRIRTPSSWPCLPVSPVRWASPSRAVRRLEEAGQAGGRRISLRYTETKCNNANKPPVLAQCREPGACWFSSEDPERGITSCGICGPLPHRRARRSGTFPDD